MNKYNISIIISTKNNSLEIAETISKIDFNYLDYFELIVIDASDNNLTKKSIAQYFNTINKYIKEDDKGLYDGMNKGALLSESNYILFLNSGDVITEMNNLINTVKEGQKKGAKLILCDTMFQWSDGNTGLNHVDIEKKFSMPCSHQGMIIDKTLFCNNLYNLNFKICADYEFYKRIMKSISQNEILIKNKILIKTAPSGYSSMNVPKYLKELWQINNVYYGKIFSSFYYLFGLFIYIIKNNLVSHMPNKYIYYQRFLRSKLSNIKSND